MNEAERRPRLLVVDDHPLVRNGLVEVLGTVKPAPTIETAASVNEALRLIHTSEEFDLAIVDLKLPGKSGIDLLKNLQSSENILPAVAMSGETDLTLIRLSLACDTLGFIPKTHSPEEIRAAISEVLKGKVYLPQTIALQLNQPENQPPIEATELGITRKQYNVLALMAEGLANREIAIALHLTENTVKSHSQALFHALSVHNRTACVAKARALSLLSSIPPQSAIDRHS